MSKKSKPDRFRNWNWHDGDSDRYWVTLDRRFKTIEWGWQGPRDLGGSGEQSCYDFLQAGPMDPACPADIVAELREIIEREDLGARPPEEEHPAAHQSAAIEAPRSPLLSGLLVVGGSIGIALLATWLSPLAGRYAAILLPILFGLGLAWFTGEPVVVVAGLLALGTGIGAQMALDRHLELARGGEVRLASAVDVTRHKTATRFVINDVRHIPTMTGHHTVTTVRQHGAGPREQRRSFQVAPLVSLTWKAGEPVGAWLACAISPGFDCIRDSRLPTTRFERAPEDDVKHYRTAAHQAAGRYGLTSAADATFLVPAGPETAGIRSHAGRAVAFVLAGLVSWFGVFIGWHFWQRRQG